MKRYIYFLWFCLSVAGVMACSDGENAAEPEPVPVVPELVVVSGQEMTVSDRKGEVTLLFTANCSWTASSDQPWCVPALKSGKEGKHELIIRVEENGDYDSREALLTLTAGDLKRTVRLSQAQKDAIILAKNEYTIAGEAGMLDFEVQANVDFKVSSDVDWIRQEKESTKGLAGYSLAFAIDANEAEKAREGHIVISTDELKQTITIVQREVAWQILLVVHQNVDFQVPLLDGKVSDARILWGDRAEEAYSTDARHAYAAAGKYTVTVRSKGSEGFSLKSLKGIRELDLSDF